MFVCCGPFQVRLSEACEAIDQKLDPTATSDLSQACLAKLVWILTRVKPCTPVSRLRIKTYAQLNARLRVQHLKIKDSSAEMGNIVAALTKEPLLSDEYVNALANSHGFDDEWMTICETRAKSNPKAPRMLDPNQMQLPDMLAVVPKLPAGAQPAAVTMAPVAKAGLPRAVGGVPLAPARPPQGAAAMMPKAPAPVAKAIAPLRAEIAAAPVGKAIALPPPGEIAAGRGAIASPPPQGEIAAVPVAKAIVLPPPATAAAAPAIEPEDALVEAERAEAELEAILRGEGDNVVDGSHADPAGGLKCMICHEPLEASSTNGDLQALACSHVFHTGCLERTWEIGRHFRGWCPLKCLEVPPTEEEDFVDMGNLEVQDEIPAAPADMVL